MEKRCDRCKPGFSFTVVWTRIVEGRQVIHCCGYQTKEIAERCCYSFIKRFDWTRPKWWQLWRRNDSDVIEFVN